MLTNHRIAFSFSMGTAWGIATGLSQPQGWVDWLKAGPQAWFTGGSIIDLPRPSLNVKKSLNVTTFTLFFHSWRQYQNQGLVNHRTVPCLPRCCDTYDPHILLFQIPEPRWLIWTELTSYIPSISDINCHILHDHKIYWRSQTSPQVCSSSNSYHIYFLSQIIPTDLYGLPTCPWVPPISHWEVP